MDITYSFKSDQKKKLSFPVKDIVEVAELKFYVLLNKSRICNAKCAHCFVRCIKTAF